MATRAYGRPQAPKARRWTATDKRYATYRWKVKTRLPVLRRDGFRCWVQGCLRRADVCDHIDPVTATTTDAEFYDARRLRASCRAHNLGRSYAPELDTLARHPGGRSPVQPTPINRDGLGPVITSDYTRART